MDHNTYSEQKVLESCLNGDTSAFETIVHQYQSLVCAITYSTVGQVEESEDLAQQVFVNAWKNLKQLKDTRKFKFWLLSITRNVIRDSFKKRNRDVMNQATSFEDTDITTHSTNPSDPLIAREQQAVVTQALLQIPESYREPLVLFYRQEQSIREVAEALGLSEDTVRTRLHRGRKMIKEQVASMVETTLSNTGPGKVFTTAVMASILAMALKGTVSVAAAVVATPTAKSGMTTAISSITAKVIGVAVAVAIGITAVVVIKHWQASSDRPAMTQSELQENRNSDTFTQEQGDKNFTNLPQQGITVEPIEANPPEPVVENRSEVMELSNTRHYVDPNRLTDISLKYSFQYVDELQPQWDYWFKKPDYWRFFEHGTVTKISNGEKMLLLNHKKATAQPSDSIEAKPDYQTRLMFGLIEIGQNLLRGQALGETFAELFSVNRNLDVDLSQEKSTPETAVYLLKASRDFSPAELYIDTQTGLIQKMIQIQSPSLTTLLEFDYSEISTNTFLVSDIPEGYQDLTEYLPPNFQGWLFDEQLNPVANAEIVLMGDYDVEVQGKSNANGEFNIRIPVGNSGSDTAMRYPISVRATSKQYPDEVAWTVITSPEDEEEFPYIIPSPGEIVAEVREQRCLGVKGVTLLLEPAAIISGQILDTVSLEPIPNATVSLDVDMNFGDVHLSDVIAGKLHAQTDPNGLYVLTSIPTFAWTPETIQLAQEAEMNDDAFSCRTHLNVTARAEGYRALYNDPQKTLRVGESLEHWQADLSLVPTNITVRGRVVDEHGNPISGYLMGYCLTRNDRTNFHETGYRTNENGEYELPRCPCDNTLAIRAETGKMPSQWNQYGENKGREFMYYGYQTLPVPWQEGVYEYEIDIILETPHRSLIFDVKDAAGQPIKGMTVQLDRCDVIGRQWAEMLSGETDENGQCIIQGLPDMAGTNLRLKINPREDFPFRNYRHFNGMSKNAEENPLEQELANYSSFSHRITNLPTDPEGYVFEVTMPQKGETFDRSKRIKAYSQQGVAIK